MLSLLKVSDYNQWGGGIDLANKMIQCLYILDRKCELRGLITYQDPFLSTRVKICSVNIILVAHLKGYNDCEMKSTMV